MGLTDPATSPSCLQLRKRIAVSTLSLPRYHTAAAVTGAGRQVGLMAAFQIRATEKPPIQRRSRETDIAAVLSPPGGAAAGAGVEKSPPGRTWPSLAAVQEEEESTSDGAEASHPDLEDPWFSQNRCGRWELVCREDRASLLACLAGLGLGRPPEGACGALCTPDRQPGAGGFPFLLQILHREPWCEFLRAAPSASAGGAG